LRETASLAAQRGIPAFSTTLLISVYQRHDEIRQLGEALALQTGVRFLYRDFRPRFREAQQAADELGLYRQPYCGCVFSEAERYERKLRRPRPRLGAG
ncbi:MAG TPA: epoxyqueuosine reductase QueH, partial [Armatimonadota bacterium]|nr:epoxyqueuosine reductase QueH [Armatimonadota bacterium]